MKQCTKCKEWKDENEFYRKSSSKDKLMSLCKDCVNEYHKKYCQKNKEKINKYRREWGKRHPEKVRANNRRSYRKHKEKYDLLAKQWAQKQYDKWLKIIEKKFGNLKCSECGYNKYFEVLEFHHIDPKKKEFKISYLIRSKPTPERIKELDKCILLCPTCHKELHYKIRKEDKK